MIEITLDQEQHERNVRAAEKLGGLIGLYMRHGQDYFIEALRALAEGRADAEQQRLCSDFIDVLKP